VLLFTGNIKDHNHTITNPSINNSLQPTLGEPMCMNYLLTKTNLYTILINFMISKYGQNI